MLTLGVVFSMLGAFGWRVWRAVKHAESLEE
jgi:predicted negative regulator of RcsB-dependent stress response